MKIKYVISLLLVALLFFPIVGYTASDWLGGAVTILFNSTAPTPAPSSVPTTAPTSAPTAGPTPQPNPSQPLGGPSLPAGHSWSSSPTFDDEFNNTSINTALWNGLYSGPVYWCSNGGCPDTYAGNTEGGGNLQQVYTGSGPAVNSSSSFQQQYGYWEAQGEWPNDNNGAGDGADPAFYGFMRNMGVAGNGSGFSGANWWEIDMMEAGGEGNVSSTGGDGGQGAGVSKLLGYYASIHSWGGLQFWCPVTNGVRLDQGMHTYGFAWWPIGNGDDYMQMYLDGQSCVDEYTSKQNPELVSDPNQTFYMILQNDDCAALQFAGGIGCDSNSVTSEPMLWNYVRVWSYN